MFNLAGKYVWDYRILNIRPYFYVHPDTQCAPRMYKYALRSTKQKLNNKPTTRKYEYY
jgi:hypothetical protein